MIKFKSKKYPKKKSFFLVFQDYAWEIYLYLFSILMLILFYQLATHQNIFYSGILGVFAVTILGNIIAGIKMQRQVAEIVFYNQQFYIKSIYDVIFKRKPNFFPIPYANPRISNEGLSITYFDNIITIEREEWEDWGDIYQSFLQTNYWRSSSS